MPWKAPQGRGCRCPGAAGQGTQGDIPASELTSRGSLHTGHGAAAFPSGAGRECWLLLRHPSSSLGVSLAPLWCRRQGQQETAFLSLSGRAFPRPLPCVTPHVTQAFDNWEGCRSWWSCQSASPLNRWKTSEICASTEVWETVVPVKWALSFPYGKLV